MLKWGFSIYYRLLLYGRALYVPFYFELLAGIDYNKYKSLIYISS